MREQLFFNPVNGCYIQFRMTEAMREFKFETITKHLMKKITTEAIEILTDIFDELGEYGLVIWDQKLRTHVPARIERLEDISVELSKSKVDDATLELTFYYDKEDRDEVRTL